MSRALAIGLTIMAVAVILLVLLYAVEDGRCVGDEVVALTPDGWTCVEKP
jgi:hypothetical protein